MRFPWAECLSLVIPLFEPGQALRKRESGGDPPLCLRRRIPLPPLPPGEGWGEGSPRQRDERLDPGQGVARWRANGQPPWSSQSDRKERANYQRRWPWSEISCSAPPIRSSHSPSRLRSIDVTDTEVTLGASVRATARGSAVGDGVVLDVDTAGIVVVGLYLVRE